MLLFSRVLIALSEKTFITKIINLIFGSLLCFSEKEGVNRDLYNYVFSMIYDLFTVRFLV